MTEIFIFVFRKIGSYYGLSDFQFQWLRV